MITFHRSATVWIGLAVLCAGCDDAGTEADPVFEDAFEPSSLDAYQEYDQSGITGVWSVADGWLIATGPADHSVLARKDVDLTDGFVEADLERADDAGLVFRFHGAGDYYLLAVRDDSASLPDFHRENFAFYRMRGGNAFMLAYANVHWPRGRATIRAEFAGSTFIAYFNGQRVITATDTTFESGSVGLRHMLHPRASSSTNRYDAFRWGAQ